MGPTQINGEQVDPLIGWCLTYFVNFSGHPAASIPAGLAEGKLPVGAPRILYLPRSTVQVQGDTAEKVLRLVENLEDNDDVQHVYANFEIPDEELAALESRA